MSTKSIELSPLGPRRFEIQDLTTGKFGLAVLDLSGQWDISPNMEGHREHILKRIHEIENPTLQETEPRQVSRKTRTNKTSKAPKEKKTK